MFEIAAGGAEAADRADRRSAAEAASAAGPSRSRAGSSSKLLGERPVALKQCRHAQASFPRFDRWRFHQRIPPGIRGAAHAAKNRYRSSNSPARHARNSRPVVNTNCSWPAPLDADAHCAEEHAASTRRPSSPSAKRASVTLDKSSAQQDRRASQRRHPTQQQMPKDRRLPSQFDQRDDDQCPTERRTAVREPDRSDSRRAGHRRHQDAQPRGRDSQQRRGERERTPTRIEAPALALREDIDHRRSRTRAIAPVAATLQLKPIESSSVRDWRQLLPARDVDQQERGRIQRRQRREHSERDDLAAQPGMPQPEHRAKRNCGRPR